MPELPEMENYKHLLNERIKGQEIIAATIERVKSVNLPTQIFQKKVTGQKVLNVERRAKHLIFNLASGDSLLLHLMLGGWMFYGTQDEKPNHTIQVQLTFGNSHLFFIGLRLGYLHLLNKTELEEQLSNLGREPLDINFSLDSFMKLAKQKRGKLKTALVDQHFLAGIGNRYSDEIAWHAQILPQRSMESINNEELSKLFQSIREVLQEAIDHHGYLEKPFYEGDKKTGKYLQYMKVHGLEGEDCPRCGTKIKMEEISSKKTYYCPECQH